MKTRLRSVKLGEPQTFKNITILPLITLADGTFQYRTLGQALADWDIAITETSDRGSVLGLKVVNRSSSPILLVDGEEVTGSRENRALNTSILIKEVSETVIPVSCTEPGRGSYITRSFSESGHLMAQKPRARKTHSVHQSLEMTGTPMADQGEVWSGIKTLHAKARTRSPNSAMSDIYKAREDDLRQCDAIFEPVPNQVGLLAILNGRPAGLDLLSLTSAYARLHPKLVRSYTLQGLLDGVPGSGHQSKISARSPVEISTSNLQFPPPDVSYSDLAQSFLAEIQAAEAHSFPSAGHGADYRYRRLATPQPSQHFPLSGAALVHADEIIHAAFFRLENPGESDKMVP